MSLDVYLTHPEYKPVSEARIYIREDGQARALACRLIECHFID